MQIITLRKIKVISLILLISMGVVSSCNTTKNTIKPADDNINQIQNNEKVVIAYVTSWSSIIPDPNRLTHINYTFGHVNQTFDGVRIDNENRLKEIVKLRVRNNKLKILLSIGGWESGRFSEMAADRNLRKSFVEDCKRVVKEFDLDGIDIDWEYPTSNAAGISASADDKDNFTRLMNELRTVLGNEKLLTLATAAGANYYDFPSFVESVDLVNIMTYDMGVPPYHHSALYPSPFTRISGSESVDLHLKAGVPLEKIVLGIPFYGKSKDRSLRGLNFQNISDYDFIEKWDDAAKVPYLVDQLDEIVFVYENPQSIGCKCDFILEKNLRGAMFWEYSDDDKNGTLLNMIWGKLKR